MIQHSNPRNHLLTHWYQLEIQDSRARVFFKEWVAVSGWHGNICQKEITFYWWLLIAFGLVYRWFLFDHSVELPTRMFRVQGQLHIFVSSCIYSLNAVTENQRPCEDPVLPNSSNKAITVYDFMWSHHYGRTIWGPLGSWNSLWVRTGYIIRTKTECRKQSNSISYKVF